VVIRLINRLVLGQQRPQRRREPGMDGSLLVLLALMGVRKVSTDRMCYIFGTRMGGLSFMVSEICAIVWSLGGGQIIRVGFWF